MTARQVDQRDGAPVVLARDAGEWEAWLTGHHHEPAGAWLLIAKKNTGVTTVTQPEALDGALCFGWIDSVRRPLDETYYLQRYSRRRRGSSWSTRNADRAEYRESLAPGKIPVERHDEPRSERRSPARGRRL